MKSLSKILRVTVSRVLNDHPNVKSNVRQRVQKIITQTGYHPDAAARSLANHYSGIIGLLIPQSVHSIFTDPYYPNLIQGITEACNNFDYTLSLFLLHNDEEETKLYPRILHTQLFDGLITLSFHLNNMLIPKLLANSVPFVLIGGDNNPQVNMVDADNKSGGYMATAHLIRTGHQPIKTLGYLAVETLLDIINPKTLHPQRIILPTELVLRSSTRSRMK